jgi:hypothetical protein
MSAANLATANLRGANLHQANLEIANLQGAFADNETVWPDEFDPEAAGVIFKQDPVTRPPLLWSNWHPHLTGRVVWPTSLGVSD